MGLINDEDPARDAIRTHRLNNFEAWDALLQRIPLIALLGNLSKMTAIGLAKALGEVATSNGSRPDRS